MKVIHKHIDPETWELITQVKGQPEKRCNNAQKLLNYVKQFKEERKVRQSISSEGFYF